MQGREKSRGTKMLALCTFTLVCLRIATGFMCADSDLCSCEGVKLSCICDQRQNITLHTLSFGITEVHVEGCGVVYADMAAFRHLRLESLVFQDIDQLTLRPFTVHGQGNMRQVLIADIAKADIKLSAFSSLYNVTLFTIRNVTADKFPSHAFGDLDNIKNFTISECSVQFVEKDAFVLTNTTQFVIENSFMESSGDESFFVESTRSVGILNSTFLKAGKASFLFSSVEEVVFENCYFGSVSEGVVVTRDVERLIINECTFQELEPNAFKGIEVSEELIFQDNIVMLAGENSLFPNIEIFGSLKQQRISFVNTGNNFTCDCRLSWLWTKNIQGMYDNLLEKNYCLNMPGTKLSSVVPSTDPEGNCTKLEFADRTPKSDFSSMSVSAALPLRLNFALKALAAFFVFFAPLG